MKCTYCGNTSGRRDTWGGCISCGGQDFITDSLPTYQKVANGWLTVGDSGGDSRKYSTIHDLPEIQEGLSFSYPIHGNSHSYPSVNVIYGCPEEIYLRWRNAGGGRGTVPNWFIRDPYPENHRDWFREWGESVTPISTCPPSKREESIRDAVRRAVGLV